MSTATLRINSHDPRGHQPFLQLSCDLQRWQTHANDRIWWLEREKQCNALFQQYGYDLQSGVWHCLIACQRSGWNGIANASLLLANGFSRQHTVCWPPLAAVELRRQILESYSRQLIPQIYTLPLTAVSTSALEQLLSASEQLLGHAKALQSSQTRALEQLNAWLVSQIHILEQQVIVPAVPPCRQPVTLHSQIPLTEPQKSVWPGRVGWVVMGASVTLCVTLAVQSLDSPSVLHISQQLWPNNPLVSSWRQQQKEIRDTHMPNHSAQQLSQQLDMLEQRLLDAEQKRKPYITISELKTSVYQMQGTLIQQKSTIEGQLNTIQQRIDDNQVVTKEMLHPIYLQIKSARSRLLLMNETLSERNK